MIWPSHFEKVLDIEPLKIASYKSTAGGLKSKLFWCVMEDIGKEELERYQPWCRELKRTSKASDENEKDGERVGRTESLLRRSEKDGGRVGRP